MFNDASSNSDVLVASDAIGMGLNLNISRIIFSTLQKFDGVEIRDLTVPEIKQIAGMLFYWGAIWYRGSDLIEYLSFQEFSIIAFLLIL